MKKVEIYIAKRNNDYGYYQFYVIEDNKDIYEELGKTLKPQTEEEKAKFIHLFCYDKEDKYLHYRGFYGFEAKEVDPDRFLQLLGD